jgi:phosphoenolpyruvate---glycerone phosphotransferase subunit DhaL
VGCTGAHTGAPLGRLSPFVTEPIVDTNTITNWLNETETDIGAQSDYLTQLDAAIGDGDHGTNMNRGFTAVGRALADQAEPAPPGRVLILAGKTLISTVGGASGPLWGTAFRRAGRALGDAETFDGQQLVDALDAAVAGVVELGAATPGDKTMIDALTPAMLALHGALDAGEPVAEALAAAVSAAEAGAESTVPLQARKGRASYLGERSIGHLDPGAASSVIILSALQRVVDREQ